MRICIAVAAFCVLTCTAASAGWVDLSANIPWPNDSMDLSSVYFIGDEGWITASYWGDSGFVYHTTDGGQTFETQHTQYPAYSVNMVTRLDGYACGKYGRVYRTTDGGATWNTLGTITTTATCIDFPPDCDTGYCCGYTGNVARVTPEGVSRMVSNAGTVNLASISFPNNPRQGNMCGESVILSLRRDTWGGQHSYPSGTYNSICYVDSFTGWACGDAGLIIHTDDDQNFVQQASPDTLHRGLFGSSAFDSSYVWVVGGGGVIERTTDGGQNWRIEAAGMTDHFLTGVFAVDTATAYVVGNLKVFLKYDGRGGVEEPRNEERRTKNVGPTIVRGVLFLPASPCLRVSVSPCPRVSVSSALFDVSGRRVFDLRPGTNDVSRLAPGVYFVMEYSVVSSQHSGRLASGVMRHASSVRKVIIQK